MLSTTWDGRESPGGARIEMQHDNCPDCGVRWIFAMTVNANTPCHFTRGLDHGCKTF